MSGTESLYRYLCGYKSGFGDLVERVQCVRQAWISVLIQARKVDYSSAFERIRVHLVQDPGHDPGWQGRVRMIRRNVCDGGEESSYRKGSRVSRTGP